MSSFSISTSGMQASFARLDAIMSNVANAMTTGPVPVTPPSEPVAGSVYQAVDVVQVETASGGTQASNRPRLPAYRLDDAPSSPDANADGYVAAPNVDLASEAVGLVETRLALRANIAVFKVEDQMLKSLLDIQA
jgi:flagellar basal-body rod protein FlgC